MGGAATAATAAAVTNPVALPPLPPRPNAATAAAAPSSSSSEQAPTLVSWRASADGSSLKVAVVLGGKLFGGEVQLQQRRPRKGGAPSAGASPATIAAPPSETSCGAPSPRAEEEQEPPKKKPHAAPAPLVAVPKPPAAAWSRAYALAPYNNVTGTFGGASTTPASGASASAASSAAPQRVPVVERTAGGGAVYGSLPATEAARAVAAAPCGAARALFAGLVPRGVRIVGATMILQAVRTALLGMIAARGVAEVEVE